jgi:error-prone DNA polymerase
VLDRLGAVPNSDLAAGRPGRVRIGGLVVTRQHPMTAKGTVFLALEDETGMVNVTLWPDTWARLRGVVRRHALLLVDGELQRQASVVNVVAHDVRALVEAGSGAAVAAASLLCPRRAWPRQPQEPAVPRRGCGEEHPERRRGHERVDDLVLDRRRVGRRRR